MNQDEFTQSQPAEIYQHHGWSIAVVAEQDRFGWRGAALVERDGHKVCRLTASQAFDTRGQLAAVLVARSDRWIAAQEQLRRP